MPVPGLRSLLVALLLPGVACAQGAPAPAPVQDLAITHVTVIDVVEGRGLEDRTVVVRGGRVTAVGPSTSLSAPAGVTTVDGRGRFLIPGLWDMHVHTPGPAGLALLPVYVAYGVTGVRDMGSDLLMLREEEERIARGVRQGPRMVMAGPILDGPLGAPMPPDHRRWRIEVTDTAAARTLVDSLADAGADFIKVHERLAAPVYHAIGRQAARRGLVFAGHVPLSVGPSAAAGAGQRSIEHLVNVPIACTALEAEDLRPRNGFEALFGRCSTEDIAALTREFARAGTWHTPTLVIQHRLVRGFGATSGDPGLRHVPEAVRATLGEVMPLDAPPASGEQRQRLERLLGKRMEQVRALHRSGVGLLVGTDAPGAAPGWAVHEEMRLLVEAGLSPAAALRAATHAPAVYLGATDSLGVIAPGAVGDLVLLDADPLADIRNTQRIAAVIVNGRLFDREALDALLAQAQRPRR